MQGPKVESKIWNSRELQVVGLKRGFLFQTVVEVLLVEGFWVDKKQ